MRKYLLPILLIGFWGCEEPKEVVVDTTPPTITITSPQGGSTVYEIVIITCTSSDNEGVAKVELWVNGLNTGLIDNTEPYSFEWNTTILEDGNYTIVIRSYDLNENIADTEPIVVSVDNTESYPIPAEITPIAFDEGSFYISWSQNNDHDFHSYTLYKSEVNDMSEQLEIYSSGNNADTNYTLEGVNGGDKLYFQLVTQDTLGLISKSNIQMGVAVLQFYKTFSIGRNGNSIDQTSDGGYIIAGSASDDGYLDGILLKLDEEGNEIWSRLYEGDIYDYLTSVQQTTDGGFIAIGSENSSSGNGNYSVMLVKTDTQGQQEWINFLGVSSWWVGSEGQQTNDGGYIITGSRRTVVDGEYQKDVLLLKTNIEGDEEWHQTFDMGYTTNDYGRSIIQTNDGGYVIAGYGLNENEDDDVWLIKTDLQGVEQWNESFGGSLSDRPESIQQTTDGGFIIVGVTKSYGNGDNDVWLIKTNSQGQEEWSQTFGGSSSDWGYSVQQTTDSGYIISGSTYSYGNGECDVWLIKTDSQGQEEWNQTFGGSYEDKGYSVIQTLDSGYIITGVNEVEENERYLLIIKTDSEGNTADYDD